MKMNKRNTAVLLTVLLMGAARANNLQVANVAVSKRDNSTAYVTFDLSWENSWRFTNVNHDAAWVFFKVQPEGGADWQHVTLEGSGTNPTGYATGTGTGIELVVPDDRVGLFVRRAAEGFGTVSVQNVTAVWNFAANSLVKTSKVRMQALAVEMVYAAAGDFAAGGSGSEVRPFTLTTISTGQADVAPAGSGSLGGQAGGYPTGQSAPNALYPNGHGAFYCMKYELTEGQWVDFFNTLTEAQKAARDITSGGKNSDDVVLRNTVAWSSGDAASAARDRACSYVSWADGCAFADWAGLRPMTELEFEKACRGPLAPVANEYAWGTATITPTSGIANDGTGTDTAISGNCNYWGSAPNGPYRAGIYATGSSTREQAGATYWGIMELSGNLWEHFVSLGPVAGNAFTGLHGNGTLEVSTGNADVAAWPGPDAGGTGLRGGGYPETAELERVSDRTYYDLVNANRNDWAGWRAVRTAPAGVQP